MAITNKEARRLLIKHTMLAHRKVAAEFEEARQQVPILEARVREAATDVASARAAHDEAHAERNVIADYLRADGPHADLLERAYSEGRSVLYRAVTAAVGARLQASTALDYAKRRLQDVEERHAKSTAFIERAMKAAGPDPED